MNRRLLPLALFVLALMLFGAGWLRRPGHPAAPRVVPAAAYPVLTVVPHGNVTVAEDGIGRSQFGQISLLDQTKVRCAFTLRNDNPSAMRITRIEAGCGCTAIGAQSSDGTKKQLPFTLGHGDSFDIHAVVDFNGFGSGGVLKDIAVYDDTSGGALAKLEITGIIAPLVTFDPETIQFSTARPGDFRDVKVTVDSRLAPGGVLPDMRSDSPMLRVVPITGASVEAPAKGTESGVNRPVVVRRYRISITPDAPAGDFGRRISFAVPDSATSRIKMLAGPHLLVFGDVSGDTRPVSPQRP